MRRLLLVLVMLILSLQSTWAAVGTLCAHERETDTDHIGHHAHRHDPGTQANEPVAFSDDVQDVEKSAQAGYHADCATCHAHCSPGAMAFADWTPPLLAGGRDGSLYRRHMPDRSLDTALRPPSHHLA